MILSINIAADDYYDINHNDKENDNDIGNDNGDDNDNDNNNQHIISCLHYNQLSSIHSPTTNVHPGLHSCRRLTLLNPCSHSSSPT